MALRHQLKGHQEQSTRIQVSLLHSARTYLGDIDVVGDDYVLLIGRSWLEPNGTKEREGAWLIPFSAIESIELLDG